MTTYDSANRVSQVSGVLANQQTVYLTGINYAPHGAYNSYTYGNGLARQCAYNTRLQPVEMTDSFSSAASCGGNISQFATDVSHAVLDLQLFWGDSGTQTQHNNGNLRGQLAQNCIGDTANNQYESYGYDGSNRLASVMDNGGGSASTQTYGFDHFGNMYLAGNSGSLPVSPLTPDQAHIDSTNNRLTTAGAAYDGAGNLIAVGSPVMTISYDAENRQISAGSGGQTTYVYDGDGRRISKVAGSTTIYVYDVLGQLAAEYSNGSNTAPCQTCYLSWDHLGSTRLVTDQDKNLVARHDYLPFGQEIVSGYAGRTNLWGGMDNVNQKFTGKERDSESGLDYFGARYYGSALGRFTSTDPSNLSVYFWMLQTWNRYAYTLNNPLSMVDRNGLWPTWIHDLIIQDSFPGLSNADVLALQKASHDTDYVNRVNGLDPQDPAASFVHGMSDGLNDQAFGEAEAEGDSFIAANEAKAKHLQADWMAQGHEGISPAALTAFGNALHTITDRTSPSHRGNQPWYGTKGRRNMARAARHVFGEISMSNSDRNSAVTAARDAFQQTFGSYFFLWSINQPLTACVTTSDSASGSSSKTCQ